MLQFSIVFRHSPTFFASSEFIIRERGAEGRMLSSPTSANVLPRGFCCCSPVPFCFWIPMSSGQRRALVSRLDVLFAVASHDPRRLFLTAEFREPKERILETKAENWTARFLRTMVLRMFQLYVLAPFRSFETDRLRCSLFIISHRYHSLLSAPCRDTRPPPIVLQN